MNIPHSICCRITQGLALLMTVALLGSCTFPDPEYAGVLGSVRTDCKGNEIVGVWSNSSPTLQRWGEKAEVLLFRPDGTGFRRTIYAEDYAKRLKIENTTTQLLWHYQGAGVWTSGPATIRFAGNALAWEQPSLRYVFIKAGNESFNEVMNPHP